MVLGSGPSGQEWVEGSARGHIERVACVNGSYVFSRRFPDAYGLFEPAAITEYMEVARLLNDAGKHVFTACRNSHMLANEGIKATAVDNDYGGYHRFKDDFKQGMGLGMGAAALMLLIVSNHYRPKRIDVYGIDGYDVRNGLDSMYCRSTRVAGSVVVPSEELAIETNEYAGRHIATITNLFSDIQYVWHGKPSHPNKDTWRVTFAEE